MISDKLISLTNVLCEVACYQIKFACMLDKALQSLCGEICLLTYPFWDMTVIMQDYSQVAVLCFDKNKVHGFFAFCCVVQLSLKLLLWLVQQVVALPVVICE